MQGDNIQPWLTLFPIWNKSVVPCPVLTIASWLAYRFLKRQVRWSGIPISLIISTWELLHTATANCCFLTCIHMSQEEGKVVLYSHLLKNFPQFIVIHTVKGFGIVNEAETDVLCFFCNSLAFSMIQQMLAIWSLVLLPFLKLAWASGSPWFVYCWSLARRILGITLLECEMSTVVW